MVNQARDIINGRGGSKSSRERHPAHQVTKNGWEMFVNVGPFHPILCKNIESWLKSTIMTF